MIKFHHHCEISTLTESVMCNTTRFGSYALLFLSALAATGAHGKGEHLEPEASVFTGILDHQREYYPAVLKVFGLDPEREKELWRGPRAAVIVMPALTNEYRIALTADRGTYRISWARPEIMVWTWLNSMETRARLKANPDTPIGKLSKEEYARYRKQFLKDTEDYPDRVEDIEVERCEREIGEPLAWKVFGVWYTMLRLTRYRGDQQAGLDGVTYHFTFHSVNHVWGMGGKVWSPPEDSNTGRLVAITDTMRRYCLEGGAEVTKRLEQQADDLLKRLED